MGLAWLWPACIFMLTTVFLLCWRISMACLDSNLSALGWSLVSVWVWRFLDELLSINVPWNQEFSGVFKLWI